MKKDSGRTSFARMTLDSSFDFRQSPFWGKYMQLIGWHVETVDDIQVYIRKLPFFNISFIKIQHPLGKTPFKKIDAIAKKYHTLAVVIEPHIAFYKEKDFIHNGYTISPIHHAPTATRKIAIDQPLNTILASFSQNAKRNIKKAQRNNLKIKVVFGKDDKNNTYFEKFYALQKNLTHMKKFYAPGYEESKKKYQALKNGSFFVFAYGRVDSGPHFAKASRGKPIAAVWYGFYKDVATYLQTGITQTGYEKLANYLLVLEGIKVAKILKCRVFDFESIYDTRYPKEAKRWKGYSEFKSRFHGDQVLYPPSWIKIYNKPLKFLINLISNF